MKYYLAEACQNTFVLMDCLEPSMDPTLILHQAHEYLKYENRDDALILTEGARQGNAFYARMVVLGLDGTLGEFCGNGSRACAAYLFERYPRVEKFFLTTKYGAHPLMRHDDGFYSIKLPPARFEINDKFIANPNLFKKAYGFDYVEMIEPHLVVQKAMSDEELLSLGRELNSRKDLFPHGININAWQKLNEGSLHVKTYERGVQRLTRSCGTGSMSCAAFCGFHGNVHVSTPGGSLIIQVQGDGIVLKGPASFFDKDKTGKLD
jgi:diaminopimelate epimerase